MNSIPYVVFCEICILGRGHLLKVPAMNLQSCTLKYSTYNYVIKTRAVGQFSYNSVSLMQNVGNAEKHVHCFFR